MGNTSGNIYSLLCEGHSQTAIAKATGFSRKTIWKKAKEYVVKGKIEKIAWGRYQKATRKSVTPTLKPVEVVTPLPIMLPHKFGASFKQTGKPNLPYDGYGKASEETPLYFAQFGRYKTQIWLYGGFEGSDVETIVASGKKKLITIASQLALKYRITLTLNRFYTDIEWVDVSKERSKATARGARIRKGEYAVVAGALHKYDKHSQNGHMEFNKLPNGEQTMPTEHAAIRERLYSGEYERRFDILMESNERFSKNLEKHLEVLESMDKGIKELTKAVGRMGR